jgi:hypothetical protein
VLGGGGGGGGPPRLGGVNLVREGNFCGICCQNIFENLLSVSQLR